MPFIKNIEQKIKLSLRIAMASMVTLVLVVIIAFAYATKMIAKERNQIFILDRNMIPLVANNAMLTDYREAEYKAAIRQFHYSFFTLPPDNEYIERNIMKAMYAVDASGVAQYNTLKEKNYYNDLIATNSFSTINVDSIALDLNTLHWRLWGTQKIQRPTMITIRSLVTEGNIQDQPRTENNPHGILITNWKTLENKDLYNETRRNL